MATDEESPLGTPDTLPVTGLNGGPPTVGLKEAARLCGVSFATVRRRRAQLEEAGAQATEHGWTIPIPALVAVGLLDRVTTPASSATTGPLPASLPTSLPPAAHRVEALRAELEAERVARAAAEEARVTAEHRARLAEAVADERGRALERADLALRALTAAAESVPAPSSPPPAAEPPQEPAQATTEHRQDRQGRSGQRPGRVRAWFRRGAR